MDTVLIFGGGDEVPRHLVDDLPPADSVVAADGGYEIAVGLGYRVDVLVGDLDSVSTADIPGHVVVERHPEEKDATDLELAMDLVSREHPSRIVVVGASGGRLDHEMAVAGLLCSDRWAHIDEIDWISARATAHVVRKRRLIHGDVGSVLTMVPMNGDATGVVAKGLRWPLDGETLPGGTTRGVSNVMEAPVADIRVGSGCLLVITAATSQ